MSLRNNRTPGRSLVHVEVARFDEQPVGVPDPNAASTPARDASGRYQAGHPATVAAARSAGRSRARHTALSHTLGVTSADPAWLKLKGQAEAFRRAAVRALRESVGAGQCGPAPASCVASAALARAGSLLAFDRGDLELFSRLALESRQHLLAAQELCAREAQARPRGKSPTQAVRASAPSFQLTKPPTEKPTE